MTLQIGKSGLCELELDDLDFTEGAIWHKDHFDKFDGNLAKFADRITEQPTLNLMNIEISSIAYQFDIHRNKLVNFINCTPLAFDVDGFTFHLPEYLQIEEAAGESYYIKPLYKEFRYYGVLFSGGALLNPGGVLSGNLAESIVLTATDHPEMKDIEAQNGKKVTITHDGIMRCETYYKTGDEVPQKRIELIRDLNIKPAPPPG